MRASEHVRAALPRLEHPWNLIRDDARYLREALPTDADTINTVISNLERALDAWDRLPRISNAELPDLGRGPWDANEDSPWGWILDRTLVRIRLVEEYDPEIVRDVLVNVVPNPEAVLDTTCAWWGHVFVTQIIKHMAWWLELSIPRRPEPEAPRIAKLVQRHHASLPWHTTIRLADLIVALDGPNYVWLLDEIEASPEFASDDPKDPVREHIRSLKRVCARASRA